MKFQTWVKRQIRKKSRVYILPTKLGGYLIGLIFLMFLLSIGYNNNLLLIFTLSLFSLNLMWLVQTNYHLHRLRLASIKIPHGHAHEAQPVVIEWAQIPDGSSAWRVEIEGANQKLSLNQSFEKESKTIGEITIPKRGVWDWKYLKISSERPYGLYRAWKFISINERSYAYPTLYPTKSLLMGNVSGEGEYVMNIAGKEDLRQLLPYQGNESLPINWKHYAKSGELLVKEGEAHANPQIHLVLKALPEGLNKETILSELASQMDLCQQKGISFVFEYDSRLIGPVLHPEQVKECMKVLAKC